MLQKWLPQSQTMEQNTAPLTLSPMAAEDLVPDVETDLKFAEFEEWDETALTRMVGDNPAIHRKFLDLFLVKGDEQRRMIQQAAIVGDTALIGSIAHAFKSSSRSVGALRLGEFCQALEHAGKASDLESCKALISDMQDAFETVERRIKQQSG